MGSVDLYGHYSLVWVLWPCMSIIALCGHYGLVMSFIACVGNLALYARFEKLGFFIKILDIDEIQHEIRHGNFECRKFWRKSINITEKLLIYR